MSTYFLLDPFEFPYCFYRIRGELIYVSSMIVCIPSTFWTTLGHHQGRIYYKSDVTFVFCILLKIECIDVILTECILSLHEITSVFQSVVIFMSCRIMEFKICIFRQHFFVNTNFIKHNRYFLSTYFLLDPFEFPYYFYRAESTRDTYNYGQYINQFPPNTIKAIREFEQIQKKICRQKISIMFNEICIYIYMCVCVCVHPHEISNLWN